MATVQIQFNLLNRHASIYDVDAVIYKNGHQLSKVTLPDEHIHTKFSSGEEEKLFLLDINQPLIDNLNCETFGKELITPFQSVLVLPCILLEFKRDST